MEFATLEGVDWFNHRRLLESIGYRPPAEVQTQYSAQESAVGSDSSKPVSGKAGAVHLKLSR